MICVTLFLYYTSLVTVTLGRLCWNLQIQQLAANNCEKIHINDCNVEFQVKTGQMWPKVKLDDKREVYGEPDWRLRQSFIEESNQLPQSLSVTFYDVDDYLLKKISVKICTVQIKVDSEFFSGQNMLCTNEHIISLAIKKLLLGPSNSTAASIEMNVTFKRHVTTNCESEAVKSSQQSPVLIISGCGWILDHPVGGSNCGLSRPEPKTTTANPALTTYTFTSSNSSKTTATSKKGRKNKKEIAKSLKTETRNEPLKRSFSNSLRRYSTTTNKKIKTMSKSQSCSLSSIIH